MSYSFRDKPRTRLSDLLRGKSGDELLQEMRQEFDNDLKGFSDFNPNWGFTPAGSAFPRRRHRGSSDLRAHLDDLAKRHPEFAEHLRSPPGWVSDFLSEPGFSRHQAGASNSEDGSHFQEPGDSDSDALSQNHHQRRQQQPTDGSQQTFEDRQEPEGAANSTIGRDSLSQRGFRNTDPEIGLKGQAAVKEDRNQRSMSAPPDGRSQFSNPDRPQRFVSKIEINPVNPATGETAASSSSGESGKPPMAPPKPQQHSQSTQQQPQQSKQNVRHIPIFVEGRDEPVLPKNVDSTDFSVPPSNTSRPQFQPHNTFNNAQPQFNPSHQQPVPPQRKPSQSQHEPQPKPQEPKLNENVQQSPPTTEKRPKTANNDPISKVQEIQYDVDQLRKRVDNFNGTSRSDKEFIYLDEMLTRNLIKLDNIETDGKENVRAARKDAIKSIQQCISILESKVPQTPITSSPSFADKMDVEDSVNKIATDLSCQIANQNVNSSTQNMETDPEEKNGVQPDTQKGPAGAAKEEKQADPMQTSSTEVKC